MQVGLAHSANSMQPWHVGQTNQALPGIRGNVAKHLWVPVAVEMGAAVGKHQDVPMAAQRG